MELNEILAKIAKGETLTDDEKKYIAEYDQEKHDSSIAAAARRKAETERDALKAEVEKLKGDVGKTTKEKEDTIQGLNERMQKLESENAASKARLAAIAREEKITNAFSDAKISAAAGVSEKTFAKLRSMAFDGVDVDKPDAVKAALESFKAENAALIADASVTLPGAGGKPKGTPSKVNPFAKDTYNFTEQLKLYASNPEEAKRLEAEAGVSEDQPGGDPSAKTE